MDVEIITELAVISVGIAAGIIAPIGLHMQKSYLSFVAAMVNFMVMLSALLATLTGKAISEEAEISWLVNLGAFALAVMFTIVALEFWSLFLRPQSVAQ